MGRTQHWSRPWEGRESRASFLLVVASRRFSLSASFSDNTSSAQGFRAVHRRASKLFSSRSNVRKGPDQALCSSGRADSNRRPLDPQANPRLFETAGHGLVAAKPLLRALYWAPPFLLSGLLSRPSANFWSTRITPVKFSPLPVSPENIDETGGRSRALNSQE